MGSLTIQYYFFSHQNNHYNWKKEKRNQDNFRHPASTKKHRNYHVRPFDCDIHVFLALVLIAFRKFMENTAQGIAHRSTFFVVYNENCLMNQDVTFQFVGKKTNVHFTVVRGDQVCW